MAYKDLFLSSFANLDILGMAGTEFLFFCLVPFIASFVALSVYKKIAPKFGMIANQNERSSHEGVKIVSGGLCLILVLFFGILGFVFNIVEFSFIHFTQPIVIIGGLTLLLSVLGFLDDKYSLSPKLRLLLQMIFVGAGLYFGFENGLPFFDSFMSPYILWPLLFFGWIWFINLYNFMDGIDGITSIQTLSIITGLFLMNGIAPELFMVLSGVIIAFLVFNLPPSKMFMGDSGSIALGYFLGFFLIKLAGASAFGFIVALILPLYYLVDATYTLIKRVKNGHKPWDAHRTHFYQQIAGLKDEGHKRFIIYLFVLNIILIGLCYLIPVLSYGAIAIAIAITALSIIWMLKKFKS